ncbi:serine/threonine-protein kinase [Caballeronia novacaledonica]|uniref:non-specific serine/threonine protein kinase n=1 Tax=Caballeronia novacaledonica TaxID=1544861 RepID=A0AA37IAS9_9BURK|nr:serine/threonine-protein kinase [Caballeronia novacaledonica]GJH25188.1 serine/threonine protein kinase [Caballeronia novacaledonica]
MKAAAMDPPRIAQLGKYRIDAVLGAGAMGVVYRAFDPHIERHVALKTVRHELFETGERASLMTRLRSEAQAAGRLTHPNIVGVYDYGEADDTAYIAMELVSGHALKPLLDAGRPLALATALDWFAQLLAALGFAHEHGVVHRDIKPANLLVSEQGRLKVADFGVAHVESSTLTLAGAMIGTPCYMSPEQFTGEPVDGRSDLFSAAIVLYQMLTGCRPFAGASQAEVMRQVMHETPRMPSVCNPALPAGIDDVLMRALSRRPAARFQTADALRQALQHVSDGSPATPDDCTILEAQTPTPAAALASSGTGSLRGDSLPSLTMWPAATLASVEARLAAQIGPVARLLVRRAAARIADAPDLPALVALLAPHVPSDRGRAQFVAAFADGSGTGTAHGATSPSSSLDAQEVRSAALKLAVYLGPIATIIAKREAARAASLRALYERLAAAISDEHDRARFQRDAGL